MNKREQRDFKNDHKIQHLIIMKTLKLTIGGNFLNLVKDVYKQPIAPIILSGERLDVLP